MRAGVKRPALSAATVGIMAATLTAGKLALSFIPNVEIVTLFIALYSYCFGALGLLASFVFVITETLIYGFGGWVVSYLIYWPLVALVFMLLGFLGVKGRIIPTVTAVTMTALFGVLTSLVEIGLFSGFFDNFFYRFSVYYLRGAVFYAVHVVSNTVIFLFLFSPLRSAILGLKSRLFSAYGRKGADFS